MPELYEHFPELENEKIVIGKMSEEDVDALSEITGNPNVYRFISPFLFQKNRGVLLTAIKNLGGRDFDKKKMIIAGIYLKSESRKLIGLAEMFDWKKRDNKITIGYRINEAYWHQGIATSAVKLMKGYLLDKIGISVLQAFVMPGNVHSKRALLRNGFQKEEYWASGNNWGGQAETELEVYTCRKE